jgi:hypothetical protein
MDVNGNQFRTLALFPTQTYYTVYVHSTVYKNVDSNFFECYVWFIIYFIHNYNGMSSACLEIVKSNAHIIAQRGTVCIVPTENNVS